MRRRERREKTVADKIKFDFLIAAVFLFIAFMFFDSKLRPVVNSTARYRLQSMVTQAANDSIIEELEKNNVTYQDLVLLEKDENGRVLLISYNSFAVNKLKSLITSSVLKKINELNETNIYIPLGNITNIDILQNKGPKLCFTITPYAYAQTDIESEFVNTGINQTEHKIFIVINISAAALIPNYSTDINLQTKVCVAQTVIIGKVPDNIYD